MSDGYKWNKRWRKKHPDTYMEGKRNERKRYYHKYPVRYVFSQKVYRLLKRGRIEKTPCVRCGSKIQVQACSLKLDPYKPLWLCDPCNKKFHSIWRLSHGVKQNARQ